MTYKAGEALRGYQIHKFVEAGGFSSVYQAYQDSVNRNVAIKVIENDELVKSTNFIRRFEVEAQIIARLEHPHIVPIYDFWREPDRAFIVMRWLDGGSIRTLFGNDDKLRYDKETLRSLITNIGSALHFVHQRNIVHRDIKPDNILVDGAGNFYLTDFGIAIDMQKRAEVEAEFLRIGTPDYMSPEQILYDEITAKSDVYAFAILLYEVLTRELPFPGDDMDTILLNQVNSPFPSILDLRSDLPLDLDDVFVRATQKSPENRYDTVFEFMQAILPLIDTIKPKKTAILVKRKTTDPIATVDLVAKSSSPATTSILNNLVVDVKNPYKGLKSFDETDEDDFYGRDVVITQMMNLLQRQLSQNLPSFMAIIGASGSGKSSVAKAGLIPKLRYGEISGSENWFYVTMTPGTNPIENLIEKLNSIAIYGDDTLFDLVHTNIDKAIKTIAQMVGQEHIFILIDQFEEVFTQLGDEENRRVFIDLLVKLCQSDIRITVVITLRADFYDKPLSYRDLGELIQAGTVTVLPLSTDELEQVIVKPAEAANVTVQPSLVSLLVADTIRQPNALPLLQFTVTELFDRRENNALTLQAYEAMGRLQGAIVQRAETVYLGMPKPEQEIAQRLFLQLVILSESNETVRRRVMWRDALMIAPSRESVESVINSFGESRLLTFDNDPVSRQPTIEVAHEALIQAWTRLQIWIAENRGALLTYNRLSSSVRDWLDNKRDNSFLARDVQLLQYEELYTNSVIKLSEDERNYVAESQALRRRNQLIRYAVIASLVVLTFASVVVSFIARDQQLQADSARQEAVEERDRANVEAEISDSRALAATALNIGDNARLGLLTAVEANRVRETYEARDSLANILYDLPYVERFSSVDLGVRDFVLSSDQQTAYLVGDSNRILVRNVSTSEVAILASPADFVLLNSIAIGSDDRLLAVGGQNGVAVFDTRTGQMRYQFETGTEVWSVAWSPDDEILYYVDASGDVRAVAVANEEVIFDTNVTPDALFSLSVHPNGDTLAVGGADNIIYIIESASGDVLYEFTAHSNWVLTLSYSPDGQLLASGSADLSLIVWNLDSLQALGQIPTRHTDWIREIAFNDDASEMLTASADGTLRRWDVASGRQVLPVFGQHFAPIWSAVFVADDMILSADRQGQLIEWSLQEEQYPLVEQLNLETQISTAIVLDDLKQVAVATNQDNESASLIWIDLSSGYVVDELSLPSFVSSMDYHADSRKLAITGIDQTVRVLDMTMPEEIQTVGLHNSIVSDIAFSPDGSRLISVDDNEQLVVWDMDTFEELEAYQLDEISGVSIVQFISSDILLIADRTGTIALFDGETFVETHRFENAHDGAVTDILIMGEILYSVGRDGVIVVWDIPTRTVNTVFPKVHTDWILDVAEVNDQTIVTIGRDGLLILWDVEREQSIGQPLLSSSSDWGLYVAVDEAMQTALTFYRDGYVGTWQLSLGDWIIHSCELINTGAFILNDSRREVDLTVCNS